MSRSTNLIVPEVTTAESLRVLQENVAVFNEASGGAIVVDFDKTYLEANGGDHVEPIQFARPSSVDSHVDEASPTDDATFATLAHAKGATVFQARRGALEYTRDELMRGKFTQADYSLAIGQVLAEERLVALRNCLLGMGVAAVDSMDTTDGSTVSANIHIVDAGTGQTAGSKTKFSYSRMNTLLNKMGDARDKIAALVMHSAVAHDLIADGLSNYSFDKVAGMLVYSDIPAAMGRKLIVVDSSELYSALTSSYYSEYYVLGLAQGALRATIISEDQVDEDTVISKKVKKWQFRQDYDVEFAVQGMKWTAAGTNVNPTDAELKTAARWDENYSDHREAGIIKGIYNAT